MSRIKINDLPDSMTIGKDMMRKIQGGVVFGKRSGIQDSHDRYTNTDTAYLLQRMEEYIQIAEITSNQ